MKIHKNINGWDLEEANRLIDENTEWLKNKLPRIIAVLKLDESQIKLLGDRAEKAQGYVLGIFEQVFNFIKWVFEKIHGGIIAVIEATKWVVQKVQDFVEVAISKIRQIFQTR